MPTYEDLVQICAKYNADKYYVDELIPDKKLANARTSFSIPDADRVIALADTTVFGSSKNGLAVCDSGIYWCDLGMKPRRSTWNEFVSVTVKSRGKWNIEIGTGEGSKLHLSAANFNAEDMVRLLSELKHLVRDGPKVQVSRERGSEEQWMVSVSGQQYGPYDEATLRNMVQEGLLEPSECLVWKEGMLNWLRLEHVPRLRAATPEARVQSTPPPLPPAAATPPAVPGSRTHQRSVVVRASDVAEQAIDLNHAPLDELLVLPGFELDVAERLVEERDRRGGFDSLEEVGSFFDLRPHVVELLRERVSLMPSRGGYEGIGRTVDF